MAWPAVAVRLGSSLAARGCRRGASPCPLPFAPVTLSEGPRGGRRRSPWLVARGSRLAAAAAGPRRGRCSSALPFFAFFASFAVQTVVRAAGAAPVLRWRDTGGAPDLDETLYYCQDANMNATALVETDGDVAEEGGDMVRCPPITQGDMSRVPNGAV